MTLNLLIKTYHILQQHCKRTYNNNINSWEWDTTYCHREVHSQKKDICSYWNISSESGPAFSTLQVLAALPSRSVFSKSEFSLFCL